jgi:acetylornithine/succinyldiaminopimelate/putrescine aminotransferase
MLSLRSLFLQHVGQTSPYPVALEVERAKGVYIYGTNGRGYIDLVSGVSVSNVGHSHPKVVRAIQDQAETYMHLMVYGEFIEQPQVKFAKAISDLLPDPLQSIYFVNSGSEAVEGAMKLAKRVTGRKRILAFENAYHGSTQGALSIYGGEELNKAVQPLLPNIGFLKYNHFEYLDQISEQTACVVMELIQSEAGIIWADKSFITALREKCNKTGTLLVIDEVQTGFGRTGKLFAFEHFGIVPDILCTAKAMGGGMPIGAFISSKEMMDTLTVSPALGHITTFGGHPVSCSSGLAALEVLLDEKLMENHQAKGQLFVNNLKHPAIKKFNGNGLFMGVELDERIDIFKFLNNCIECGVITDPFLFHPHAFRIAPPLIIQEDEIIEACRRLLCAIEKSIEQ